jgi:hypothetical protein
MRPDQETQYHAIEIKNKLIVEPFRGLSESPTADKPLERGRQVAAGRPF